MKFISTIDKISDWSGKLVSPLFVVATFVIVYAVISRYVFNAPTVWGLELTVYLCSATYIFGGAYALRHNAHIRIDILYRCWSPRVRAAIDVVVSGPLLFVFCGILIWQGGIWAWDSIKTMEHSVTLWSPIMWPVRVLIPIGTFLLLLQGVARFIRDLRVLRGQAS